MKDFDELLRRLQEMGYEIKQGKYISFRAAGQERFTRTKTLGAAYTEEAIKERIKGVYVAKTKTLREDKKIRLVVDLENSIKAQQSAGYERWAKIHNLKQAAKSMNFLTENKIEYYSELESKIADIMTAHDAAAKAVKEAPRQSLWQAGRSRLSRKAPRCSTRLNGQRKRAGHWAAVGFPYGQHRLCGCSRGSFRPTHLSTFRRFGRRLRQRLICPCPG